VIVKTFSLPVGGSDRRIETRLMTRQDGEWAGYSYMWNDEQTDATLVEASGVDRDFMVGEHRTAGKKQAWHFPSRAECMVCHSRAANWLLGVSTAQFNNAKRGDSGMHDQLASLEKLGVFKVSWLDHWRQWQDDFQASRSAFPLMARTLAKKFAWARRIGVRPAQWIERSLEDRPRYTSLLPKRPTDYPRLTNPADVHAPIDQRVRGYLHSNCASCHVLAGGGNSLMELSYGADQAKMKIVGEKPKHDSFGRADALLIAPGDPERSVLLERLSRRGPGQMPPLATNVVDQQAVDLVREWIIGLKKPAN
jgi:hypothetical protein